jgi:hypothetical protein
MKTVPEDDTHELKHVADNELPSWKQCRVDRNIIRALYSDVHSGMRQNMSGATSDVMYVNYLNSRKAAEQN